MSEVVQLLTHLNTSVSSSILDYMKKYFNTKYQMTVIDTV